MGSPRPTTSAGNTEGGCGSRAPRTPDASSASSSPGPTPPETARDAEGLDAALEGILARFAQTHRLDHAHRALREALYERLRAEGMEERMLRLFEVNLFGSLSGWMDFVVEEHDRGRDAVPDFARQIKTAFLASCRRQAVEPGDAVRMALELATAIMDLAVSYQRHLNLSAPGPEAEPGY